MPLLRFPRCLTFLSFSLSCLYLPFFLLRTLYHFLRSSPSRLGDRIFFLAFLSLNGGHGFTRGPWRPPR